MHFKANGKDDKYAGLYVVEQLKSKGIDIPIVICSSLRFANIDGVETCVHYNERSGDLDWDMQEALSKINTRQGLEI